MKITKEKKKRREGNSSASTSSEAYEGKPKRFYFVSNVMQSPDPQGFPAPSFNPKSYQN